MGNTPDCSKQQDALEFCVDDCSTKVQQCTVSAGENSQFTPSSQYRKVGWDVNNHKQKFQDLMQQSAEDISGYAAQAFKPPLTQEALVYSLNTLNVDLLRQELAAGQDVNQHLEPDGHVLLEVYHSLHIAQLEAFNQVRWANSEQKTRRYWNSQMKLFEVCGTLFQHGAKFKAPLDKRAFINERSPVHYYEH
mmetsp:Transcript_23195/g.37075  ORF Transcript_23195/g.37075 Transcript_23195/m.37075 type:complete len:192 (-) Transcript_23195:72-647(-)